jgi:hypothetical protein
MLLFNIRRGLFQSLGHSQLLHHHGQSPSTERRHRDLILHIAQLALSATSSAQDSEIEQLLKEQVFVLLPDGIGRREETEFVCERSELAADSVIFHVVFGTLNSVATNHSVGTVGLVRGRCREVDFAK